MGYSMSAVADTGIGPRGPVSVLQPCRPGDGTSYRYRRDICGRPFSFTLVLMPGGERRIFVSAYNGYCADENGRPTYAALNFGCAWSRVRESIIRPDGTVSHRSFCS